MDASTNEDKTLDMFVFGRRLRARRVYRDITVENIADRMNAVGVDASTDTLYRIERGQQSPSLPQLYLLMQILDVPFDYFDED